MERILPKELPSGTAALIGAALGVAIVALGWRYGIAASILVIASLALLAVIGMAFRAVQGLAEPDLDAEVDDAPTPAEMQKQSALRALKDLEYERSIGNIDDNDYRELEARYREEAKLAMRAVDAERAELRAKAELLAKEAIAEAEDEEAKESAPPRSKPAKKSKVECPSCGTPNDPDAKFCKECAVKLGSEVEAG